MIKQGGTLLILFLFLFSGCGEEFPDAEAQRLGLGGGALDAEGQASTLVSENGAGELAGCKASPNSSTYCRALVYYSHQLTAICANLWSYQLSEEQRFYYLSPYLFGNTHPDLREIAEQCLDGAPSGP